MYIYIYIWGDADGHWLRTNGVNTNGAAAKAMNFDRLGKKYALALWEDESRLTGVPHKSPCQKA